MKSEIKSIEEICLNVCSGGTPASSKKEYYENGTIPWLTTGEVNFNRIYDTVTKITEFGLKKSSAKIIPINSVIVAMYGVTAGRVGINKIELCTNQACCNLEINPKLANYEYVYYFLKMQFKELNGLATGGAQQNLNAKTIKKYKINIFDLETQNKIASILRDYDIKIDDINNEIKKLEQVAFDIYVEWFINQRIPNYSISEKKENKMVGWSINGKRNIELPSDWHVGKLSEICEFKRGKNITASEMEDGDVPVISAGINPSGYHNASNVKGDSLTISASGANAGYLKYNLDDIWAADCSYYNNHDNIWFIYNSLKFIESAISNLQVGAAQPHVYPKNINKLSIIIPSEDLIKKYNCFVNDIYEKIKIMSVQSKILEKQRKMLLPRLMTGEIEL